MAYQLRSRKDPTSLDIQEQTDTPEGNLTEIQVTTPSQIMVVPPQLSETEHTALPVTEASLPQTIPSIPVKPETVSIPPLDTEGPTRFDPGLGSATLSVKSASTGTPFITQRTAPAQASASMSYQYLPTDTVGPPSTVITSRDASLIGNQAQQLYETIDTSSLSLAHDSQEVKHTIQAGTTLSPDVVVARPTAPSFHTSITTYSTQQSESVAEQQEWFPTDDSTSMPDLSPHYANLELSSTEMASLPETVSQFTFTGSYPISGYCLYPGNSPEGTITAPQHSAICCTSTNRAALCCSVHCF